ncbi:MAG: MATE family efflux transporter, partial [Clostridia bacterium]
MSDHETEQRIAGSAQLIKGSFTKYLAVSVLMVLSVTLGMFIDNVIAGNFLGADAVATIGISTPIFMLFAGAAGILSTGGSALAARALGRRDHKSVNALFTLVLLSACAVGLVLAVLLVLFSPQVAGMLGASEGLLAQNTAAYLSGLGFTALTSAVLQVMLSFTRVDNAPVIGLVSIVVMGISAACFDLIAILVFHAGMFGMGLATTAAYGLA